MQENVESLAEGFIFGSKAGTLNALRPRIQKGRVLPLSRFTVEEWFTTPKKILLEITTRFGTQQLIARSSCSSEDQDALSGAGRYLSVPDIKDLNELRAAIDDIIESYDSPDPQNEVFVQPMAQGVLASGVAMTCAPETGLPYYVVNFTLGGDTAGVTSGDRTGLVFTAYKFSPVSPPAELEALIPLLRELEDLTSGRPLDVEFALDAQGPISLQVRPMTAVEGNPNNEVGPGSHDILLRREANRLDLKQQALITAGSGAGALFGIMPDWNPAEMIGIKPRPLGYSLYKELITDVNWASARFRYGYRDMRNQSLMTRFCGTPYVCVPLSVESFIPATMPQDAANSIKDAACRYLAEHRHLHDKVEFAVIPTCYTPSLAADNSQFNGVLSALSSVPRALYLTELKNVTERIISEDGPFFNDLKLIPRTKRKIEELIEVPDDGLHAFRQALREAKVVGELFSGAARAGFIATAILKSMEHLGRVEPGFTDTLISGVRTVGKEVTRDFHALDKPDFLNRHGHVRPGTYDIRVRRYDEDADIYFDWDADVELSSGLDASPMIGRRALQSIRQTLRETGFTIGGEQFLHFATTAIAAREKIKYLYGALVSEALKRLTCWGSKRGFSRDDLSFLTLRELDRAGEHAVAEMQGTLEAHRRNWHETSTLRTPEIICQPDDLFCHTTSAVHPNFVTRGIAESLICVVTGRDLTREDLREKIVLIESADPGFDWIFTHNIRGFITAYGGENSHMSIRAREFKVPAAIGVGDALFRTLTRATRLRLDCVNQRIQVLN